MPTHVYADLDLRDLARMVNSDQTITSLARLRLLTKLESVDRILADLDADTKQATVTTPPRRRS